MAELKKLLVLVGAVLAFLFAAYFQGGGTWRGPLPKTIPAQGGTIGFRSVSPGVSQALPHER
jgi:hypothetical protein